MKKLLIIRIIAPFIFFAFVFSGCENLIGLITNEYNGKTEILFENFGYKTDKYSYDYIDKEDREYFRNLISTEMEKYPESYFKVIGSYKICVVKHLIYKQYQRHTDGFASGNNKVIFISVAYGNEPIEIISGKQFYKSDSYICEVFHHEQQHLAEYALWKTNDYYWKEYEDLYTGYHISTSTDYKLDYNSPVPKGFINHYQTVNPGEDRADIMGHWFARNAYLISKAKNDDLLDKKISLVLALMRDKFSFPSPLREYNQQMGR